MGSVKAHDEHIEAAALQLGANVLTSDVELAISLKEAGVRSYYPLELFDELNPGSLQTLCFGERPTSKVGSLFFRGNVGGGKTASGEEVVELFTWPQFSIQYNFGRSAFLVLIEGREVLQAPYVLKRGGDLVFGLSWQDNKLILRIHDVIHPVDVELPLEMKVDFRQQIELGRRFNGTIFIMTMDDRTLEKKK